MAPWHPRHRSLLNERQALLRLPQDRHPTWHPGIRAIAACSTSGRPSFVFLKTADGRVSLGDTAKRGTAAVPETFLAREAESQPQEMYHTHWTRADDVDDDVD